MNSLKKQWRIAAGSLCLLTLSQVHAAPQDDGQWTPVLDWPTIAIHSVLTPQGKVLNFGTDRNGVQGAQFFYDVWDPNVGTHNTLTNTLGVDSFCSAAVLMPESGNVLMAGGDNRPNGGTNRGIKDAPIFNTQTNGLSRAANMSSARWYPTSTVLANGEILLSGGSDGAGQAVITPEIYSPTTNQWRSLFGVNTSGQESSYPRHWVARDGRIFGFTNNKKMYYMNPNGNGSLQEMGTLNISSDPYFSTAVMYQQGKILHVGAQGAEAIDINGTTPSVRAVARPRETGRAWAESVILPNGKVLIVGGSNADNQMDGASLRPEIWDPSTENWSLMSPAVKTRLYHSTALLLKDGRILVAGGGAPGPQVNTNAEIFSPPYLFNSSGQLANRPTIVEAPSEAPYDAKINVMHTTGTRNITRVTLIKTGAVTHSFNMEQRFIELDFTDQQFGVNVRLPSSPNLATPGYYLLHLIDDQGVPSVARIIRISNTAQLPAKANPDYLALNTSAQGPLNPLRNDSGKGLVLQAPSPLSSQGGNVVLANNQLLYTPKPGFNGQDSISYSIKDYQGRSSSSVINLSISNNNTSNSENSTLPVANPDTVNVTSSSTVTLSPMANDTGVGYALQPPNAWSLKGGRVVLSGNQLLYTPKSGFNGEDKIWYSIKDSQGRSSFSVITLNVSGNSTTNTSSAPVAKPDTVNVTSSSTVTLSPVANDTGAGLALQAPNAWSLKGGRVVLSGNQLRYTPKSGFNGEDKIWYSIKDSQGRSSFSVITLNVSGNGTTNTSSAPVAKPDTVNVTSSSTVTLSPVANDTGAGLALQAPNAWSLKGGRVVLSGNQLRYTPKSGFNGEDKIWYSIKDSQGRSSFSVITLNVSGNGTNNDVPPTGSVDSISTTTGATITIDVLANDTGTGLTLTAPNQWSLRGGNVSLVNNKLVYKSKAGFTGSDNIWYIFRDSQGRTSNSRVDIRVNAGTTTIAPSPIANADTYTVPSNATRTLNILANDTPSAGLVIDTLYEYTAKGGRTSRSSNNREVIYRPKSGFTGVDDFWYVLIDSQGRKNSAKVTINVTP